MRKLINKTKSYFDPSKWGHPERRWALFLAFSALVGLVLRVIFVQDMEYKEDEEFNYVQSQLIGNVLPWPWYGIGSGVYIVNPGMSIWVFTVLAKITGAQSPTALAHALQVFAFLGMSLIIPFSLFFLSSLKDRKAWFWAYALAMVNPFLVLYQRKLWPEPFLPFFTMVSIMGWWRKEKPWGALIWGIVGACLGQIHMSGFFLSAALVIWTVSSKQKVHWKAWFLGSTLGALPLIPWLIHILQNPVEHAISSGWDEIVQLKYWVFWITDPLGLHLGNALGLLRGPSNWDQISDFIRYPLVNGKATYLSGAAHLLTLICAVLIWASAFKRWMKTSKSGKSSKRVFLSPVDSKTALIQNSAFLGCGILLTATGVMIRRYYMTITFPFEFIFLIRLADPASRLGKLLLTGLWIGELIISANFVGYIHHNSGSVQGDYGEAYYLRARN